MRDLRSILVVEDDPQWAELISLWLKTAGYLTVRFAAGAAAALRLVHRNPPDCILLDHQLDGQDGLSLCRRLRETRGMEKVPIIMLTQFADKKLQFLRAGADGFVAKSSDGQELLAVLEALLRRLDLDSGVLRHGDLAFLPDRLEVLREGRRAAVLTPKTYRLLLSLAERSPAPVPREELFKLVEGRGEVPLSRALDILVNRLRKALPPALSRRIRSVRGFGYTYIQGGSAR